MLKIKISKNKKISLKKADYKVRNTPGFSIIKLIINSMMLQILINKIHKDQDN